MNASRALGLALFLAVAGCGDDDARTDAGSGDGGVDAAMVSDGGSPEDGGSSSMTACSFNADCPTEERCECSEETGCFCMIGARGTGQIGVDPCTDGNDCASSVCVEGPTGDFYCSGECTGDGDCAGMLPRCVDVALVGRICVREAP